ncbi:hypothetical protein ACIQRS_17235 [Streptomyces termitum]|uniref:Uncharacterized protein n=1 Tax=Streptomyces termitum TaxID=67368 RepID=A0A918SZA6_9ACTN|nr:hypothetical protein [Streptomyces termitum]GHA79983.1 hypothetical protein GCM10010305_24150 [Streptomyces termitum]
MKIESLLTDLTGDDSARADAAAALLTERYADLMPELLETLSNNRWGAARRVVERILAGLGRPAFDAVAAVRRGKGDGARQAGRTLAAFDERCADGFAELAAEADYGTADDGFRGLIRLRTGSEAALRALVEQYGRGGTVPYTAAGYARLLHDELRPRLRALRRDPAAGPRARRGALAALVAGGGADALGDRDRAAVERLVRVKIPHEVPQVPSATLCGWWLAVPGETYEGIFEALDLHERRPVTCRAGSQASEGEGVELPLPGGEGTATVGRVFVSPELNGWRLVFGPYGPVMEGTWEGIVETVERASAHCGRAQIYFLDDAGGADIWMAAEDGRVIRRYAAESDPEWEGDPLPGEPLAVDDPDFDPEVDDDVPANAGVLGARSACAVLSVDPETVGADTEVRGHGWLALTAPGFGHGAVPGVLRL